MRRRACACLLRSQMQSARRGPSWCARSILLFSGWSAEGEADLRRAALAAAAVGDDWLNCFAQFQLALCAQLSGNLSHARSLLRSVLALAETLPDLNGIGASAGQLGLLELSRATSRWCTTNSGRLWRHSTDFAIRGVAGWLLPACADCGRPGRLGHRATAHGRRRVAPNSSWSGRSVRGTLGPDGLRSDPAPAAYAGGVGRRVGDRPAADGAGRHRPGAGDSATTAHLAGARAPEPVSAN